LIHIHARRQVQLYQRPRLPASAQNVDQPFVRAHFNCSRDFVTCGDRKTVQRLMWWAEESPGNVRAGTLCRLHDSRWTGPEFCGRTLQTNTDFVALSHKLFKDLGHGAGADGVAAFANREPQPFSSATGVIKVTSQLTLSPASPFPRRPAASYPGHVRVRK